MYKLGNKWYAHKDGRNKTIDFVESYMENGKGYQNANGNISEVPVDDDDISDDDGESAIKLTENDSIYYKNGKAYISINGKTSGGFDEIITGYSVFTFLDSGKYAFTYRKGKKYYVNINGNISEGYNGIQDVVLTKSGKYAYAFSKDDKDYLNVNGNIYEGYNISLIKLTENGNYAYRYEAERWDEFNRVYISRKYINANGKIVGDLSQYANIYNFYLTNSGNYAYTVWEGESYQDFVNVNGKISEASLSYNRYGYIQVHRAHDYFCSKIILTESGNYAYTYKRYFQSEIGTSFININGKIDGGFADIAYYNVNEKGDYIYCYVDENKNYGHEPLAKNRCVNINGKTSCGFDYFADFTLTDSGEYAFRYGKNGKHYINTNGNIEEDTTVFLSWETLLSYEIGLESDDKKHSFYSSQEHNNVEIDGAPCGKTSAVQAWYDEKKNAFVWTAIEGKELVIYEYKLN